jgi:diguanylate cyclase (GGDEF)-like protein/PAS domain S-box-containing protein
MPGASAGGDLHAELLDSFEKGGTGLFWATDAEGQLTYISETAATRIGKSATDLVGTPLKTLFRKDEDDSGGRRSAHLLLSTRKPLDETVVALDLMDRDIFWSLTGKPVFDQDGGFAGYRGFATDVSEEQCKVEESSRLAEFDSLTGLSNRHRIEQKIETTLAAFRDAKRVAAVLMMDLDRFKQVNDTLGHAAGDELLKQVAERLRAVAQSNAEIGRLGGDEFVMMIPDMDDRGRLGEIGQKIIAILSQPFVLDGSRAIIGSSVGIAIAPYDGLNCADIMHSADLALYAAKHGGRGQYRFYSADLKNSARDRRGIEADLERALERGEFELNYQPITSRDGKVVALEALLRWYHPERGLVRPDLFIPIAEDSNLMVGIGEWVLRTACHEASSWPSSVRVNVNVSSVQLLNEAFPSVVASALSHAELPANRLELELNEKVFLRDTQLIDEAIKKLRALGVRLALDDFGAGMSSLGYLKSAHFDTLKIDPEFLRDALSPDNRNGELMRAICALAQALGMDSVAEAVEAMDELQLVRECGVTHVQGYVYAKPMDVSELSEYIGGGHWTIEPDGPQRQRSERRRVFRKINLIHEDHFYEVMLRDLSRTGAMIEGLADVPLGERFVLDFGEGQLAVAVVIRSQEDRQGLEFEIPLVPDGAGGLCTRHRVSPYALAAAGMPLQMLPPGQYPLAGGQDGKPMTMPKFAQLSDAARKKA